MNAPARIIRRSSLGSRSSGHSQAVCDMVPTVALADCVPLKPDDIELAKGLPVESFSLLWRASQYAQNAECGVWHFAIDAAHLLQTGLSEYDLRWLACKGFVEHSLESSPVTRTGRRVESSLARHFTDHTSFVLTPRGQ